jgi:hypothetical protein
MIFLIQIRLKPSNPITKISVIKCFTNIGVGFYFQISFDSISVGFGVGSVAVECREKLIGLIFDGLCGIFNRLAGFIFDFLTTKKEQKKQ